MGSAAPAEPRTVNVNANREKTIAATNPLMTYLRTILEGEQLLGVFVENFFLRIVRQLPVAAQIVQVLRELVVPMRNVRSVEEMFRADVINGGRQLRFAGL